MTLVTFRDSQRRAGVFGSDLQISLPLHTAHSASALCSTLALVLNDLVYGYLSTHVYLLYVISDIKQ